MTNENEVKICDVDTIQQFFEKLEQQARSHVRLVKVADQGLVEPANRGGAIVMQPMVRSCTAFDYKANEILRWVDKWDVGSGVVSLDVTAGLGRHNDPTGARTRDSIIRECQKRSLQVVRGEEWTPKNVVSNLAGIGSRTK